MKVAFGLFSTMAMAMACSPTSEATAVNVELVPARATYRIGESIDLRLVIRNTGDHDTQILFSYPGNVGVSFQCHDPGATAQSAWRLDGRLPSVRLQSGEEHARTIALNRYLAFDSPKAYTVNFLAEYLEPVSDANPKPTTFTARGQFVVNVVPGPLDPKRADAYAKDLAGDDPVKQQEAVEMLLWTDDPSAIEALRIAARRVPDAAPDVVRALGKFFGEERAREAILEVAREGSAESLRVALEVYDKKQGTIPVDFFRAILNSHYSGKTYPTLLYLKEHGDLRHLALVQPFEDDENPEISKLASEVVAKVTKHKP